MRTERLKFVLLVVAVMTLALPLSAARGDPTVLGFEYSMLDGTYTGDAGGGNFTAMMTTDLDPLKQGDYTSGRVDRLAPPEKADSAFFLFNPLLDFGQADFLLDLAISNIDTVSKTADGVGTITAWDIDGDKISGDVVGTWQLLSGQGTFTGQVSNILVESDEMPPWFNGQFDTGFDADFSEYEQVLGAVTDLTGLDGFFDQPFSGHSSRVTVQAIPAPGAVVLGALGLGVVGWVRRRLS